MQKFSIDSPSMRVLNSMESNGPNFIPIMCDTIIIQFYHSKNQSTTVNKLDNILIHSSILGSEVLENIAKIDEFIFSLLMFTVVLILAKIASYSKHIIEYDNGQFDSIFQL